MDPDIEDASGGASITADVPTAADIASEVRMPLATGGDETQPRDDAEASSGVDDPADIVVEQRPTDGSLRLVAADDRTASSTTGSTAATKEKLTQLQQASDDDLRSDEPRWPKSSARSALVAAGGGEITIDDRDREFPTTDPSNGVAAKTPTGGTPPQRAISSPHLSSPTGSGSNGSEADSGGTDGEERSSTQGRHNKQPEMESEHANQGGDGEEDRPSDLSTQLNRIWGVSLPDRAEGLAVMRDMLGYRAQLDGILSRLVAVKVRCHHLKQRSRYI